MEVKVLSVRKYKIGYEVRREIWYMTPDDPNPTEMVSAYTPSGDYIGTPFVARHLITKYGVAPEKAKPEHTVCSIGYSETYRAWYGWSHRAICGFGIGDMVYEEDYPDPSGQVPFVLHGTKRIENMDDAKQAAINFAKAVS